MTYITGRVVVFIDSAVRMDDGGDGVDGDEEGGELKVKEWVNERDLGKG